MPCPNGLNPGFGVPARLAASICASRSYFGIGDGGLGIYVSGTGFFIGNSGGRGAVLTAAHNLYHPGHRRYAKWVDLFFGRIGDAWLATRRVTDGKVPHEFEAGGGGIHEWDFALGWINPLGSDRFEGIPLAKSTASGATGKLLAGYPNEGSCKGKFRPYSATFQVTPSSGANYSYIDQRTYEGMSGGPLIASGEVEGVLAAWGLHTLGGENGEHRAVRFSATVLARIRQWL